MAIDWLGWAAMAYSAYQDRKRRKEETARYDEQQRRTSGLHPMVYAGATPYTGQPMRAGLDTSGFGRQQGARDKDQKHIDFLNKKLLEKNLERADWENLSLMEDIKHKKIQNALSSKPLGSFENPEVGLHWWKLKTKDGKELRLVTTKEELAESMEGSSAQKVMYMFNINYGTYKQLKEMF